jgi:predicted amidohydrolase YtcJ
MTDAGVVFKNADVITMDQNHPTARAVVVQDGRILAVGLPEDVDPVVGPATHFVDCAGGTLIPGLIDAHCHIFSFLRKQLTLDLGGPQIHSIADIQAAVRRQAEITPPGRWINGSGYSDFSLAEKRHPTRWELDAAASDYPVIISHHSLHACVLNSRALALAGIGTATPEPPGGSIQRDIHSGEPDGVLYDMLGYIRYRVMTPLSEDELTAGLTAANRQFLAAGLTSLQDATVTNDLARWQLYQRFQEKGLFQPRIYLMTGADRMSGFLTAGLDFRAGDDSLRLGGLKIVLGEATGRLFPSQPDLDRLVLDVHRNGGQVAIHAVEPSTIDAALIALEKAQTRFPRPAARHRLEHCAEAIPPLFERIRRLNPVISLQPPFLYYSGERYLSLVTPENIPYLYRIKSFLEAGLTVAAGSDNPVVPHHPMIGLQAAILRITDQGHIIAPHECISPLQALALYTTHAARASFDEDVKGSLTPGKLADLVLLDRSPLTVSPERIGEIKVLKTFIGGRLVWEA